MAQQSDAALGEGPAVPLMLSVAAMLRPQGVVFRSYVRCRPFSAKEKENSACVPSETHPAMTCCPGAIPGTVSVLLRGESRPCIADGFFGPDAAQSDSGQSAVYERIGRPAVAAVLGGGGVCRGVIAHGITSAGKTHTLFGVMCGVKPLEGLVPRCLRAILPDDDADATGNSATASTVSLAILELYCDQFYCLVTPPAGRRATDARAEVSLKAWGGGTAGPRDPVCVSDAAGSYVKGAQWATVCHVGDFVRAMNDAFARRSVAATHLGQATHRSAVVVIVRVSRPGRAASTLTFVDSSGSERPSFHEQTSPEWRCAEKSRATVYDVLRGLRDGEKHIPYRNSRLTQLLCSLMGSGRADGLTRALPDSHVDWIGAVSPAPTHAEESSATLRFAHLARTASADALAAAT